MIELGGGCLVIFSHDASTLREGTRESRTIIGVHVRAHDIAQTESFFDRGISPGRLNPSSEEVHYVLEGAGACYIDGYCYPVEPGSAAYVPAGSVCCFEHDGPGRLRVVSVCCPEALDAQMGLPPQTAPRDVAQPPPRRVVHERERDPIPTGIRTFKLLADTDLGCQRVTQFLGVIPPSEAEPHYHTYEEAIYILEGSGTFWAEGREAPIGPGTCIYLPRRVWHATRNRGTAPIRLIGVFHPSGSPAAAYMDREHA